MTLSTRFVYQFGKKEREKDMARFFEAIDDVSGDYARIFNKSSIEVINFTSSSDLDGVGYNPAFNIPLDKLEVGAVQLPLLELVNNPSASDLASYKDIYADYPLIIRGAHTESFYKGTGDPVAVTPITYVTDFQHIITGEKKKCVTKTYYFLERTKSGKTYYWRIVRLTICAVLENQELYQTAYQGSGVFEWGTNRMWLRYDNVVHDDVIQIALAGYNPASVSSGSLDPSYHDSIFGNPYSTRSNLSPSTALEYLLMVNEGEHINAQPLIYIINEQRNGLKGDRAHYIGNPCINMIGTNWTIYKEEESRMGIPIKKIFRNVDYLHNIDVYDETNRASKNMMLENYIGTTNYELVNFSSPNGVIRVKGLKNFTHFVGAGFGNNNTPRVYRVTSYKTIGSDIVEYSFTLDYLKDYFQHYNIDENNDLRVHAGDAGWYMPEKTLGTEPLRGLEVQKTVIAENIHSSETPWLVTGAFSGSAAAAFLLTDAQLLSLYNHFITSESSEKDAGAIFRIERIDYSGIVSNTETANLDIWGNTIIPSAKRVLPSIEHVNEYKIDFNLFYGQIPFNLYNNGVEYNAKSALYVEYYGAVDCSPALKRYLHEKGQHTFPTRFKLTVDIVSGQTSLSIDDITDFPTGTLPQMPIITNNAPQQIRQWGIGAMTGVAGGMLGGVIGGIKTGNAAAVAGLAAGGAVAGVAKSIYDYNTIMQTAGPQISGGAGGTAYNGIFIMTYKPEEAFSPEALYDRVGYPTDTLATIMESWIDKQRYSVELIDPYIGTEEYGRNVKAAIEEDYIIYNYSTAAGV